jgi:hypothetical protein
MLYLPKERNNMLLESEKICIGEKIAEILMLREDKGYFPKRYKTTWGNKTALGIYGTVKRLIEENQSKEE